MISVNRALSELKLITKKIGQKTNLNISASARGDFDQSEVSNFKIKATADIQQLRDLISRRNDIKSAIVASNAATMVTIGNKAMTVAQAIERKSSIAYEKGAARSMRENYFTQKKAVEMHNEGVEKEADKQASNALSADTEGDKGAAYTAIVDAYVKKNKALLVAPDGIEETIDKMQDAIDEFENEVDFILSESNIKTMIDV
jgi:hypothetical protein